MAERENPKEASANPSYAKTWDTFPGNAPQRSDADIKRDVEGSLFRDPDVRSYEVSVDVRDGNVTLSGTVDDDLARAKAEDDARAVPGVKQVLNNLQVKSPTKG